MGKSIRMWVEIDISKPLKREVMLKVLPDKQAKWFYLRYERLHNFCYALWNSKAWLC